MTENKHNSGPSGRLGHSVSVPISLSALWCRSSSRFLSRSQISPSHKTVAIAPKPQLFKGLVHSDLSPASGHTSPHPRYWSLLCVSQALPQPQPAQAPPTGPYHPLTGPGPPILSGPHHTGPLTGRASSHPGHAQGHAHTIRCRVYPRAAPTLTHLVPVY